MCSDIATLIRFSNANLNINVVSSLEGFLSGFLNSDLVDGWRLVTSLVVMPGLAPPFLSLV